MVGTVGAGLEKRPMLLKAQSQREPDRSPRSALHVDRGDIDPGGGGEKLTMAKGAIKIYCEVAEMPED